MKKFILFFVFISSNLLAQDIDELVNTYLEKTNLKESIASIIEFQLSRVYKSNTNNDYSEQISVNIKENKYFKKKSLLERDFFYVFNDGNGWIKIPMGSRDKAPNYSIKDFNDKEKADYQAEVKDGLFPFYQYAQKGYTLVSNIRDNIDGISGSKIILEKGNMKREYFFDAKTGLIKKETYTINGITHSTIHSEYAVTQNDFYLPAESVYSNTKDNKNLKMSTTWEFQKPLKGAVSFIK